MAKTRLTVKTELGTFTRTTARTYSHVVVVDNERAEVLESERLRRIAEQRVYLKKYELGAGGIAQDVRPLSREFDLKCHAEYLADGSYTRWIAGANETIAKLEATGPITADVPGAGVIGWAGRLDLARKLATSALATRYRTVKIFDVTTGGEVR